MTLDALALSDEMIELVRTSSKGNPEGLMRRLCAFAAEVGAWDNPAVESLLGDVFVSVLARTPPEARPQLGEALAAADWAPPQLIRLLAQDDIDLARPLIASRQALDGPARVALLHVGSLEHRIELARGPDVEGDLVAAILDQAEPVVLTALADNHAATLAEADLTRLVEAARQLASLRAPLARRPDLTIDAAEQLYPSVGEPLRALLSDRFGLYPATPEQAAADELEQLEMEARLVAKLQSAGQLRPSYLLRALREGRLSLFAAALACLAECPPPPLRAAVLQADPEVLALACAAVGIDRSVFPTLLALVRDLAGDVGGDPAAAAPPRPQGFALSPEAAADALRAKLAEV